MWYEVRMHVDDLPWIYVSRANAFRKALRKAERSGCPVLVYECSRYGEKLIGVFD